jgi:hypothetical protein
MGDGQAQVGDAGQRVRLGRTGALDGGGVVLVVHSVDEFGSRMSTWEASCGLRLIESLPHPGVQSEISHVKRSFRIGFIQHLEAVNRMATSVNAEWRHITRNVSHGCPEPITAGCRP